MDPTIIVISNFIATMFTVAIAGICIVIGKLLAITFMCLVSVFGRKD